MNHLHASLGVALFTFSLTCAAAGEASISCPKPNTQSTASCTVKPAKTGDFKIAVRADATGNGHGQPTIWAEIKMNGGKCEGAEKTQIAWKDGPGGIDLECVVKLKANATYRFTATSGNANADATGISMKAEPF